MKNKRILVISKWGDKFIRRCRKLSKRNGIQFVKAVNIEKYEDIPNVKRQLHHVDFDVALIAAGVGAIVLSQHIAKMYGKVAIDVGKGMQLVVKRKISLPDVKKLK